MIKYMNECLSSGSANRYEEEASPPPRNAARQQKPAGGGQGYGEYDYLYKNSPVCVKERIELCLISSSIHLERCR